MPVRYSAICLSISIHVKATFFSNKFVHCKYHCFFTAGDFLSSMAISWDQGRSSHSSQLPCQVCIPLSRVFRYTFSWILGGEEWQMFDFQCTPLRTIWCSNTSYGRVYGKWLRVSEMTSTECWLFQEGSQYAIAIYLYLPWSQKGVLAVSSSVSLSHRSLLALPGLPALLGLDPSGHQTTILGSTCLCAGARFCL